MKNELLKGHLDLLLLTILGDGPAHGYAIIGSLRERSGGAFDLPEGTVYPALHRLERDALLNSFWADVGGRSRRVYEINSNGREALVERNRAWRSFAGSIQLVLQESA